MVMPIGRRSLTFGLVNEGFNSGEKVLSHFDEYSHVEHQVRSLTNERLLSSQDCGLLQSLMLPKSQPSRSKAGSKTKVAIDVG